jgi:GNAT superfamily N-acetyltransferase
VRAERLPASTAEEVVTVLCEAFQEYPVMRYVLGSGPQYDRQLRTLIDFFVTTRVLRDDPLLGSRESDGRLVAAAIVTLPERPTPAAVSERRDKLWNDLGEAARERYEAHGTVGSQLLAGLAPHHHLNMVGVLETHRGRGLARGLVEAVDDLARADAGSAGVSLTTEDAANVKLYQRLGFQVLGHARIADALECWGCFKPR